MLITIGFIRARWNISISLYDLGFVISKPDYNKAFEGSSTEEIKNEMRKVQLVNEISKLKVLSFKILLAEWKDRNL